MALTLTDSQQATLSVAFVDKKGNLAASPAGTPSWLTDNTDLVSLAPSSDGLSCVVSSTGPLGSCVVTFKMTAADGTTTAAGTITVTVTAGDATSVTVTAGTPTEQS